MDLLITICFQVISGKASGKKLLSVADSSVRPMMEIVRGAVFDMLLVIFSLFYYSINLKSMVVCVRIFCFVTSWLQELHI